MHRRKKLLELMRNGRQAVTAKTSDLIKALQSEITHELSIPRFQVHTLFFSRWLQMLHFPACLNDELLSSRIAPYLNQHCHLCIVLFFFQFSSN